MSKASLGLALGHVQLDKPLDMSKANLGQTLGGKPRGELRGQARGHRWLQAKGAHQCGQGKMASQGGKGDMEGCKPRGEPRGKGVSQGSKPWR